MKSICLALLMAGTALSSGGATARTDINPALQYFQAFNCPDLSPADRDYLFQNEWRGEKKPQRFGELVAPYDKQITLIHPAAPATRAPECGIYMRPGAAA